jgi:hypothetical protein
VDGGLATRMIASPRTHRRIARGSSLPDTSRSRELVAQIKASVAKMEWKCMYNTDDPSVCYMKRPRLQLITVE